MESTLLMLASPLAASGDAISVLRAVACVYVTNYDKAPDWPIGVRRRMWAARGLTREAELNVRSSDQDVWSHDQDVRSRDQDGLQARSLAEGDCIYSRVPTRHTFPAMRFCGCGLERGSTGSAPQDSYKEQQRWYFSEPLVACRCFVDKSLGLPCGAYATTRGANTWT